MAAQASSTFTISDLAREFDLTTRAIRFYEDMGLIAPARSGRNRVYAQRDRTRLKLTLRGKRLGLSLRQIRYRIARLAIATPGSEEADDPAPT